MCGVALSASAVVAPMPDAQIAAAKTILRHISLILLIHDVPIAPRMHAIQAPCTRKYLDVA
jgi:hypothetical protein